MAKIDIYTNEIASLSTRLKKISSVIADAEKVAANVQSSLDFQVAAKSSIDSSLSKVRKNLRTQNAKMTDLANLTAVSGEEFISADGQMNKKTQSIIGKIKNALDTTVRSIKNYLVSATVSKHAAVNNVFLTSGSVIAGAGVSNLISKLKDVTGKEKEKPGGQTTTKNETATKSTTTSKSTATTKNTTTSKNTATTKKPALTDTGSSYKNAKALGITYYTQGKKYNKYWNNNAWKGSNGKDYSGKASVACGICCDAMIASHFGVKLTPGQLLQANGGSASWDGSGVVNLMKKNGLTKSRVVSKDASPKEKISKLDDCLAKYEKDPKHNAPPMVSIYSKGAGSNHFVMVVGKDKNGNYIIVDPANDERTTLKVTEGATGKGNKTGYASAIKSVFVWKKK